MPNFTLDQIREIMDDAEKIRNMSVIAHVDHGKSTLTDSLIAKAGIIAGENAGNARFTDGLQEEIDRGITIKSTGVSLYFEQMGDENEASEQQPQPYLINLIDSPGHVDFSSEVTAALRVTDGALVVVDYIEGVAVQTETVLRQALTERIRPVVMINKIDRGILELKVDGETMYQNFLRVIESTNAIIATYEYDDMGASSLQVDPVDGNVAFGSALFGWAFTLNTFAKAYSKKFNIDKSKLVKKLWGDNYYNPETSKFQTSNVTESGKPLQRSFVQFIMRPIIQLSRNVMNENLEAVWKMCSSLNIEMKAKDKDLRAKDLLKCVFKKWLNAGDTLLEMITKKLPSPKEAQAYRAAQLYEGPIDDPCGQAIKNCDKNGPLMVFISKMVPANNKGRFYAFGRVFSGTVSTGQKIRIMGPNFQVGSSKDLHVTNITRTVVMMGHDKAESMPDVPCGCTVALAGIDQFLVKQGTLTDFEQAHCIKAMKYSVSPVVQVAVEPVKAQDLPKLIEGLRKLAKSDPLVVCQTTDSGQHIVAGSGELHVEVCLKALREFANCPIKKGNPIVQYKETVSERSSQVCLAKSANKHNRIYAVAEPLGDQLAREIEEDKITSVMEERQRSQILTNQFDWDPNDSKKVWCFGPQLTGSNMLVDTTSQAQYLREIRDSIEAGFQWVTSEGVLTEESMKGVRFNIVDVMAHGDNAHRGGNQIIPATRRAMYAAQLTAETRLQEPIFLVQIQTTRETVGSVYNTIAQRRGVVISEEPIENMPMTVMTAHLPVSESFGLTEDLRGATGGQAFPQCSFDHWEEMKSDPLDPASRAGLIVEQTRLRKGMPVNVPPLKKFLDKL